MLSLCGNTLDFKLYLDDFSSSVSSSRKSYKTPHPSTTSQCLHMTGHGDFKVTLLYSLEQHPQAVYTRQSPGFQGNKSCSTVGPGTVGSGPPRTPPASEYLKTFYKVTGIRKDLVVELL